jgi:aquaporin Z
LIVGDWAIAQLWLFWLAPLAGALLAGGLYRLILQREVAAPAVTGQKDVA